jgi:hypothetical protein
MNTSKSTILVISMGFLVLYLIFGWQWAVIVSLTVGLIGVFSNYLSVLIEKGWMQLALLLSHVMQPVILTIVFYLFLFPVSLLSKIFTKDPLMLSGKHDSYFIDTDKQFDRKSFEKIW